MEVLAQARIPSGPAFSPIQAINDPGVLGSGVFRHLSPRPGAPELPIAGLIARLSASPGTIRSPAPEVGADTLAALRAAGFADDEIEALAAEGCVVPPDR